MKEHKCYPNFHTELQAKMPENRGIVYFHQCRHCSLSRFVLTRDGKILETPWSEYHLDDANEVVAGLLDVDRGDRARAKRKKRKPAGATMPQPVPEVNADLTGQVSLF